LVRPLQIQKRQENCKTLSATPLVHPRDHYFLIRNLLRKIPKRRRRRKTLLYCRNHRCEGLWTKVLLWLPETDPEYCNDNITLKEPEIFKENSAQNPRSVRFKERLYKAPKSRENAEKTPERPWEYLPIFETEEKRKSIPGLRNNWRENYFPPPGRKTAGAEQGRSFCYKK
jgi:hypothetical protein